ncbi:MAG TPA: CBS domain-containing protein [Myxococcaceae bacterium]|jgi:acetoin utilization protein AcuB|nr:CBS domain-containing protein [Myxococcaceae bacterium]
MRVHEVMTSPVHSVGATTSLADASETMRVHRVHHLLVVDGRRVLGVLSARDLLGRPPGAVETAMSAPVVSVSPTTTIRQAANLLRGHGVGCIPVLEAGRPVGMVTVSDLLELVGRGADRGVAESTRWTLRDRGPRHVQVPPPPVRRSKGGRRAPPRR